MSEYAYRRHEVKTEYTRKFVHISTGLITLTFPFFIKTPRDLIVLCTVFIPFLYAAKKMKLLESVNGVDRVTRGGIVFPVAIFVCYVFQYYYESYSFFFIPMLVLALADPLAALLGQRFPYGEFRFRGNKKTVTGSFVFFTVAFFVAFNSYNLFANIPLYELFPIALGVALVTTLGEALSSKGYDNVTIPVCALIVLISYDLFLF